MGTGRYAGTGGVLYGERHYGAAPQSHSLRQESVSLAKAPGITGLNWLLGQPSHHRPARANPPPSQGMNPQVRGQ